MLTRLSAEELDGELARRNPVADRDPHNPAHSPAATALLRRILEMTDAAAAEVVASEAAALLAPSNRRPPLGRLQGARPARRLVAALVALALVAGGASAIALSATGRAIPHRTTTRWLPARPLTAAGPTRHQAEQASGWRLVGDIVPAGWKLGTPGPGPGAITCPTTSVCYVIGDTATSASGPSVLGGLYVSTDGASSWSVLALPAGFRFTSDLTCVSARTCAAGGTDDGTPVLGETTDGGHRWTVTATGGAGALVHLTCVSASDCMGVSIAAPQAAALVDATRTPRPLDERFVRTTDGGNSWTATALPATVRFTGLQCPSAADCVAVGYPADTGSTTPEGVVLWTDDAGRSWHPGTLPSGVGFSGAGGLSCGGPADCMAIATVAVPNPSRCSTFMQRARTASVTAPTSFSCTSGATVWVSTMLATTDGGATWRQRPLPASVPQPHLDDVACAGVGACWAGGTEAVPRAKTQSSSVVVGTADGGATWTRATVSVPSGGPNDQGGDAYMAVGSIACPSTTVCVALGVVDQGASFAPVYRLVAAP